MLNEEKRAEMEARMRALQVERAERAAEQERLDRARIKAADDAFREYREAQLAEQIAQSTAIQSRLDRANALMREVAAHVVDHGPLLTTQYRTCCSINEYRRVTFNSTRWASYIARFFDNVIAINNPAAQLDNELENFISANVKALIEASAIAGTSEPVIESGQDYERHCARLLEEGGWKVTFTPTSGDQGVDLIAVKDSVTLALQCKWYSSPVGNAAVQEVLAGAAFIKAHAAAVVTNATYTPAARTLAAATDVYLLHDAGLKHLRVDQVM